MHATFSTPAQTVACVFCAKLARISCSGEQTLYLALTPRTPSSVKQSVKQSVEHVKSEIKHIDPLYSDILLVPEVRLGYRASALILG